MSEVVHRCPPMGSNVCPCCDRTPFELSHSDRLTLDPALVTCGSPWRLPPDLQRAADRVSRDLAEHRSESLEDVACRLAGHGAGRLVRRREARLALAFAARQSEWLRLQGLRREREHLTRRREQVLAEMDVIATGMDWPKRRRALLTEVDRERSRVLLWTVGQIDRVLEWIKRELT